MDGLYELGSTEVAFECAGNNYRLRYRRIKFYAAVEAHLRQRIDDPLSRAKKHLDGLTKEQQEFLLGKAFDEGRRPSFVDRDTLMEWLRTSEGMVYSLWHSLNGNHPGITMEDCFDIAAILGEGECCRLLLQSAGMPEAQRGNAQSPQTRAPNLSPGAESTAA